MSGKPFRTFEDQIQILKNRKLNFRDEEAAKIILSRVNYYNIINGYKMPFLKKDLFGSVLSPEEYITDCEFEELYSLYDMDRELKIIILKYLLQFENMLKTTIAYYFSEKFHDDYAYLNVANYSKSPEDINRVLSNISTLAKEITKNNKSGNNRQYISHYIQNHDNIPLWVLVNSLTIGNISYFYSSLDADLKEKIARKFGELYKEEYQSTERITYSELSDKIKIVNYFRNVCAHDEVLFLYKLHKSIKVSNFKKYFQQVDFKGCNLHDLICVLKLVLPKSEYFKLINSIASLFNDFENQFSSVSFPMVIELAGFKLDWEKKLLL